MGSVTEKCRGELQAWLYPGSLSDMVLSRECGSSPSLGFVPTLASRSGRETVALMLWL